MDLCDYLIITASNEIQAEIYRRQIEIRHRLGLLSGIRRVLVVPDIDGRRIGSGGSTLCCLMEVLRCELGDDAFSNDLRLWETALQSKKVLILHAGGDSKRLPVYSACGKLFIPIPGQWDGPIPLTLFDQQLPGYLSLFNKDRQSAQYIIASGDVLLRFKTDSLEAPGRTITGFCCPASPEQASRHGVFCLGPSNQVRLYLQKPSCQAQIEHQALNKYHQAMLDIGIMAFDDQVAIEMLGIFGLKYDPRGRLLFEGSLAQAVIRLGLDFYRELCCTFGSETTRATHCASAVGSGSAWTGDLLSELFEKTRKINFRAKCLSSCDFLDFGSVAQIIQSGYRLAAEESAPVKLSESIILNTCVSKQGSVTGAPAWVEGCRIEAALKLEGNNVITGLDLRCPLSLESGQCLDVVPGRNDRGDQGWFVRCYRIEDDFKTAGGNKSPKYGGRLLEDWLAQIHACPGDIWPEQADSGQGELFEARLFPFIRDCQQYKDFLWMFAPHQASAGQIEQWKSIPRFSHKQISSLTDGPAFLLKRRLNRIQELCENVSHLFRPESAMSDLELSYVLKTYDQGNDLIRDALCAAYGCSKSDASNQQDIFISSRILHSLGSALEEADWPQARLEKMQSQLKGELTSACVDWLEGLGIALSRPMPLKDWTENLKNSAFKLQSGVIVKMGQSQDIEPRSRLRVDEIVWARAPARLDMAGGWTDTPPYALEWGGAVLNAAVNLNGQPPIQAYLRVIPEPVIKIGSIDLGLQVVIEGFNELNNYLDVTSGFSLAKAALMQEIFAPVHGACPEQSLKQTLKAFGGGIELTTIAAIPKGSGLGTSSIMGAVIVAAINCAMGRSPGNKELFHSVLRLEQTLTTGGGWQDQIGGVLEGVKLILTRPGLVANPSMQYLRKDVIDPALNDGCTLLYYTGITRLAKNILRQVVGRYLNRDHHAMRTLKQIHQAAMEGAEIIGSKDYPQFGRLLARSWYLNRQLDPDSSNPQIESLFERIAPYVYGAKLLGAGGGGFILMACKSRDSAGKLRQELTADPCNPNARFFDYDISSEGLVVTVC